MLQRFYQTLSEIKSEIEGIIVTGRKLVEDRSVPEPEKLSSQIDTLKELYNKVGFCFFENLFKINLSSCKQKENNNNNINHYE